MKASKILLTIERRLIILWFRESEWLPLFLKTWTTDVSFQQEEKQDSNIQQLKRLDKIEDNSGEHICKTLIGILSGPEAWEGSSLEITSETSVGVMKTDSKKFEVLSAKSGGLCTKSTRIEFLEKRSAKSLALSDEKVRTLGLVKSGRIEDLLLLKVQFVICQNSWETVCWLAVNFCVFLAYWENIIYNLLLHKSQKLLRLLEEHLQPKNS